MKLPASKTILGTILVMTVLVGVKAISMPENRQQRGEKAKVSGSVVSHSVAGGRRWTIDVKLKDCKCDQCKEKCSECCIPQDSIVSDEDGKFQFSLGPGTYTVEVRGRDSSRKEIQVSAGESRSIELKAD